MQLGLLERSVRVDLVELGCGFEKAAAVVPGRRFHPPGLVLVSQVTQTVLVNMVSLFKLVTS